MIRWLSYPLGHWLLAYHRDKLAPIMMGHSELFTKEMKHDFEAWCQTEEGREHCPGGSKYKETGLNSSKGF